MSDFLARDVLIDVLTRLPIKTLVQCACVCKSWYSLLTNPSFITTHLNRSSLANNNNHHLLLIRRRFKDGNEEDCPYSQIRRRRRYSDGSQEHYSLLRCENEMFCDYAEFEPPLNSYPNEYFRIIGSCNGVVCLSNDLSSYIDSLYLWNPSIQKTMALPPSRVTYRSHGAFMHSIGFGFDSLTDDYKVIRIVYLEDGATSYGTPEVDIFSLSTGTWKNISHLGLPHTIYERAPQAYLNGAAHWFAYSRRNQWQQRDFFNLIVSFHMGDEVFSEIMLPVSIVDDLFVGYEARVAKFQESLSLIHIQHTDNKSTCCIWVMKEYGILESWAKQSNIIMDVVLFKSLAGFTRKGEVLFGTKAGYLVAYDPEGEAEQKIHLHFRGSKDSWDGESFYADGYTESLVLLGAKFPDTVTCEEESPVLHGEASSTKKKTERKSKIKEEREDRGGK